MFPDTTRGTEAFEQFLQSLFCLVLTLQCLSASNQSSLTEVLNSASVNAYCVRHSIYPKEQQDKILMEKSANTVHVLYELKWVTYQNACCGEKWKLNSGQNLFQDSRERQKEVLPSDLASKSFEDTSMHVFLWVYEKEGVLGCVVTTSINWKHIQSHTANPIKQYKQQQKTLIQSRCSNTLYTHKDSQRRFEPMS